MTHFAFHLDPKKDVDAFWHEILASGGQPLYAETTRDGTILYADVVSPDHFTGVLSSVPFVLPEIDWEDQWRQHAPAFVDGVIEIPLNRDLKITLAAGAGFGNLSHPTTRLMLDHLLPYVQGVTVVDIGCGSGILALASWAMGAKAVFGVEIDPLAIEHAKKNVALNHSVLWIGEANDLPMIEEREVTFLMNMIFSEQKLAWVSLSQLHAKKGIMLSSGILVEERLSYLEWTSQMGWKLEQEWSEEGWLALCFTLNKVP